VDERAAPVVKQVSSRHQSQAAESAFLEILDFTLVFYGGGAGREGSQIPATTGLGVFLSRIEPILSRF